MSSNLVVNRRVKIRATLSPTFIPKYDALCEKLGPEWQPYSGMRSFMSQDRLFAKGRMQQADGSWKVTDHKIIVTNAKGGQSAHNYGCGCDWARVGDDGELHWPKADDPVWKELVESVRSVGLRSGIEWGDIDHAELWIAVPWSTILTIWQDKGPSAAIASIEAAIVPSHLA